MNVSLRNKYNTSLNASVLTCFLCIIAMVPGVCQSSDSVSQDKKEKVYISTFMVDNPPVFSHFLNLNFETWIQRELNSSMSLKSCLRNAHMVIHFTVSASGFVKDIKITHQPGSVFDDKSVSMECLDEIKTIVKKSSIYWIAGSNKGEPVSVMFSFPIWTTN